jgi:hypothetical protein
VITFLIKKIIYFYFLRLFYRIQMIFLESIPDLNNVTNQHNINKLNEHIANGKPTFLFLYMDGCGPCNTTKEEWANIKSHIPDGFEGNNVMVAQVNKDLYNSLKGVGSDPLAFPTLRYIEGSDIEEYESGRTAEALAGWIKGKKTAKEIDLGKGIDREIFPFRKTVKVHKLESEPTQQKPPQTRRRRHYTLSHRRKKHSTSTKNRHKRKHKGKSKHGGKWSQKYKRSINCNKPRGFSQRQYCKYGRQKK